MGESEREINVRESEREKWEREWEKRDRANGRDECERVGERERMGKEK